MLSRCRNENDPNFKNYGGRGITVCERWYKFENFFEDIGDLPFYWAQIDRIDNELGYFKENCRWVTAKKNSRNKRNTKSHSVSGNVVVQQELMERIGWSKNQFRWFLKRYGIKWILDGFENGSLPDKINEEIDRNDLEGKIFGKWNVLRFESYTKKTGHLYLCRCVCSKERLIPRNNLIKGKTSSCRSCSAKNFHRLRKINSPPSIKD